MSVATVTRFAALLLLLVASAGTRAVRAQAPAGERAAVERAVLDYVEGFYEGDTVKLVRMVHPQVTKYGFWIPRDSPRTAGR